MRVEGPPYPPFPPGTSPNDEPLPPSAYFGSDGLLTSDNKPAATVLGPSSVAIIGVHTDNVASIGSAGEHAGDVFAFVLLTHVTARTSLKFTDDQFACSLSHGDKGFSGREGTLVWEAGVIFVSLAFSHPLFW
jgi:hypothetical protein